MKSIVCTPLLAFVATVAFALPVNAEGSVALSKSLIVETVVQRDVEPVTFSERRWHRNNGRHYNRHRGDGYYYGDNGYYNRRSYGRGYGFGGPGLFLNFGGIGGGYGYRDRGYGHYGDRYDRRW